MFRIFLQETYEIEDLIFYSLDGTDFTGTYDTGSDGTYNYITNLHSDVGITTNLLSDFEFSYKYYLTQWESGMGASQWNTLWNIGVDTNNGVLIGCEAENSRIRIYNRNNGQNTSQTLKEGCYPNFGSTNVDWFDVSIKYENNVWSVNVNGNTITYSKTFNPTFIRMYSNYSKPRIREIKVKAL